MFHVIGVQAVNSAGFVVERIAQFLVRLGEVDGSCTTHGFVGGEHTRSRHVVHQGRNHGRELARQGVGGDDNLLGMFGSGTALGLALDVAGGRGHSHFLIVDGIVHHGTVYRTYHVEVVAGIGGCEHQFRHSDVVLAQSEAHGLLAFDVAADHLTGEVDERGVGELEVLDLAVEGEACAGVVGVFGIAAFVGEFVAR